MPFKENYLLGFFCLNLSGCAGIYNVYGILTSIYQELTSLPHERMYQVQDAITIFLKMMKC